MNATELILVDLQGIAFGKVVIPALLDTWR